MEAIPINCEKRNSPCSNTHATSIINARNHREYNCDSNHYLVEAKVSERTTKVWNISEDQVKIWDTDKVLLIEVKSLTRRQYYQETVKGQNARKRTTTGNRRCSQN